MSLAGCGAGAGPLARWRIAHDDAIAPPPNNFEAGDTRGRIARFLAPERAPAHVDQNVQPAALVPPNKPDPEIAREFDAA